MRQARQRGHGTYVGDWRFEGAAFSAAEAAEAVTHWCREAMAATRRPWGVNTFDVAVGWRHANGEGQRERYIRCRTDDLYDGALLGRFEQVLAVPERLLATGGGVTVAVALLSWGDLAHAVAMNA